MKIMMAAILSIPAALYGCSGNNSGYGTPAVSSAGTLSSSSGDARHFEGNWQGSLTSDLSQTTSEAIALVNGWGEFRLIADGAQFVGWPRRTDTQVAGGVTGIRAAGSTWNDGNRISNFVLDGSIDQNHFIDATYDGSGDSGVIALAWAADVESRIESIAGTWVQYDDSENIVASFQIDAHDTWQASIHGSHVNGCTYFGDTEAWTSQYSYDVVPFEVSGCSLVAGIDLNGFYSGTSALLNLVDDSTDEQALVIALSNDLNNQLTFFLYRVSE